MKFLVVDIRGALYFSVGVPQCVCVCEGWRNARGAEPAAATDASLPHSPSHCVSVYVCEAIQ